jgi:predicted ATP-dependent endonuclease of OLD family
MPDVWRAIAAAATDLDVQVFATTHSHECVEAAYEATEGMAEDTFLYHRLDRVEDDVKCRTYEGRGLEIAIKTGTEFR